MKTNIQEFLESIKGSKFIKIENYYSGTTGEVQDAVVNINVSYENAKAKDIEFLSKLIVPTDIEVFWDEYITEEITMDLLIQARNELLASLIKPNKAMSNGQTNAYTHISSGIKIHNDTEKIYLFGTSLSKKTIIEGDDKADVRKPLTKAKDIIRKHLRTNKFRMYVVDNIQLLKCGENIFENLA